MQEMSTALELAIRERFAALARNPREEKRFPVGPDSAQRLGYAVHDLKALPPTATESFAGVGNPLSLGALQPGQRVLDLGCGAGLDSLLAARQVTPGGTIIGVDMVEAMLAKSLRNAAATGVTNFVALLGHADALPLDTAAVDVVISNGVFNLCLNKQQVVAEIWRVLRPAGRLYMADILLEEYVTPEQLVGMGSWSD